jgi:hypothetical protein
MALTQQQKNDLKKQFFGGAKQGVSSSPNNTNVQERINRTRAISGYDPSTPGGVSKPGATAQTPAKQEEEGFFKSLAKGIVKPFAEVGVSLFNGNKATYEIFKGAVQKAFGKDEAAQKSFNQAGADVSATRDLPFLGETTPAFTGEESTGEAAKKIATYGAEIGSTVIGGGGVAKVGVEGLGKAAFKQAVKDGVISGAYAGFLGGGAQEDRDGGDLGDIALGSLGGAAGGALVGGVAGGVLGKAGEVLNKKLGTKVGTKLATEAEQKAAQKSASKIEEFISPVFTKAEKEAKLKAGEAVDSTLFSSSKVTSGADVKEAAKAVDGFIDTKKGLITNIKNLRNAISEKGKVLTDYLERTNIPYDVPSLEAKLASIEKPISLQADDKLNKTYDLAVKKFIEFANKEDQNLSGLLVARKQFDDWLPTQISNIWEDNSIRPVHDALRKVRMEVNDYIAENAYHFGTSEDVLNPILASLRQQSLMYQTIDNMATKAVKELGKGGNFVRKARGLIERNPFKAAAVSTVVGGSVLNKVKNAITGGSGD